MNTASRGGANGGPGGMPPGVPLDDPARLTGVDLRTLGLWILAGVIGTAVAFKFFFVAFPEASVDFKLSRPEAVAAAQKFVSDLGQKDQKTQQTAPAGYESSIVFRVDENTKTYLEREVGLEQANRLMAAEVSAWSWDVRFFKRQQKEEFRVQVDPSGRIVGLTRVVEEAREGASLERDAARVIAEKFLQERLRTRLDTYDFLPEEANSTERPKRRDWSFTWERRGFKAKDAPYRLRVTLLGDAAGGYEEFLKVPEEWERGFQRLRSSNLLYQTGAQLLFAFLLGYAVLSLLNLARRGQVRWKGALKLGLVLTILFFVMYSNQWPITRSGYDTNSSYSGFFIEQMLFALLQSLGTALLVVLAVTAGEPLYRADHPNKLLLGAAFSRATWRDGLRSKEFFRSCVIGLAMAAAHIGFVVLFYLLGRNFGFWSPAEIQYTDIVSTALPWIYPLAISIFAATFEEFTFRLFAIPLLLRVTKSKFLAIVIPAFIWGFLHSAYPQEPGYVRGIEVGLIGIVAGWVMLRWGILATLVWHYTVDALLIALFLLRSESLYFRLSGGFVAALALFPLLVALGSYALRRRFSSNEAMFNRSEPPVEEAAAEETVRVDYSAMLAGRVVARGYEALSSRTMAMWLGAGVLGVVVMLGVKPETIGDFVRYPINARQAAARADGVLREKNIDAARYRRAVTTIDTFDGVTNEYLRREIGVAATNRLYQEKVPSAFWMARYFRDSEKEEYRVVLRTDGTLHSVHHLMDEKAPGASLTKEEALARAEAWLRDEKKLNLAKWKLAEADSEKHPKRTDHKLVWEELEAVGSTKGDAKGAAHVRVELRVLGDELSTYRVYIKVPEGWERQHNEASLNKIAWNVLRIVLGTGAVVLVLVLFFRNLREQRVPWRRLSGWAIWAGLAAVAIYSGKVPLVMSAYQTEFPLSTWMIIVAISWFIASSFIYSALFLAFGLAWFFLARACGEERLPSWRGMPSTYYRDALVLALGGAGIARAVTLLPALVGRLLPAGKASLDVVLPGSLEIYLPALDGIASAVTRGLYMAAFVGLLAGLVMALSGKKAPAGAEPATGNASTRGTLVKAGTLLVLAILMTGAGGSAGDFVGKLVTQTVTLGIAWLAVTRLFRFNLLAYFLFSVVAGLSSISMALLRQPNDFYRLNGYACMAALLMIAAWPLAGWLRGPGDAPQSGAFPADGTAGPHANA